jgi:hypothetical protein
MDCIPLSDVEARNDSLQRLCNKQDITISNKDETISTLEDRIKIHQPLLDVSASVRNRFIVQACEASKVMSQTTASSRAEIREPTRAIYPQMRL